MNKKYVAGVDIGGSHITVALIDMADAKVIKSSLLRNKLDSNGTAQEILDVWISTIRQVIEKSEVKVEKIGFAMPGPFDYANGICLIKGFNKYESLFGMNIREILAETFCLNPENIQFRNDAEAFLAGELNGGAGKGFNNAIGITLGTGLGSAKSHNGITVDAELSVTEYGGEIIEELVSTRGLQHMYAELSGKKVEDAKELAVLAETDLHAAKTFKLFAEHLAWFLEKFIKAESPQLLVVGGNIANAWDLFMPAVKDTLKKNLQTVPDIVKASLAEDAALVGAACIFETALAKVQ
ncbi:ROK family protein [Lacibacter luteus]|uniref:ROK family protein n=1 Tax=Lacibacter luteus TaxID=2508719 RepID=UPI0013E9775B|nr:ROK family protein [Lacibacter luteus]